jgi:DNA-binding transcriptional LysR family regulator
MSNLNHWRTFVAVYRSGSVTAAGTVLNLTQPGVSQHIQALEAQVGRKLFYREARRMVPTEEGKALYAQLAGPLDQIGAIEQRIFQARRGLRPLVRVGTPAEYFHAVALGALTQAPVRLRFSFGLAAELTQQLARGELDLVVATQLPADKALEHAPLREERLVLLGPRGVKLPAAHAKNASAAAAWLAQQRWLAYSPELPAIRRFWKVNFATRPSLEPVLVIPNFLALIRACVQGAGLTVAPEYLAYEALAARQLSRVWVGQTPAENTLWLVWRRGMQGEPVIGAAIRSLKAADAQFDKPFVAPATRRPV